MARTRANANVVDVSDDLVNPLGNVSGAVAADLADGLVITLTLTGNTVLTLASWPSSPFHRRVILYVKMDGAGGHTFSIAGASWGNAGPPAPPDANATDIYVLTSPDSGALVAAFAAGLGF